MLHALSVQHFRLFSQAYWTFDPHLTVVVGANAHGKTSLIEAVRLISTGESIRAQRVADAIQFGAPTASLQATIDDQHVDILLTPGQVNGTRSAHVVFFVNQVRRMRKNILGQLPSVVFQPEDVQLI
jgi:DNA replication and repair protein RecF